MLKKLSDFHKDTFTVGIGGAAGDGVREAGNILGMFLRDLGYQVYFSFTYPSLIRGGHNYARLTFSKDKIWCDYEKLDLLIGLNGETTGLHLKELNEGAIVFADNFTEEEKKTLGTNAISIPMQSSVKESNLMAVMRNSVALGAFCFLLDLPMDVMDKTIEKIFRDKGLEDNRKLADIGYKHIANLQLRHPKKLEPSEIKNDFLDGNMAVTRGFIAAGLNYYLAYPMTPASTILHYMAAKSNENLKAIQPENEISAINMALGISYTGKRVAVGSATGGFSLMQEAFSFAGISELPLAVVVSQRQGPATGVPTRSSQSDLHFVIHSGHGEFPRIVMAPGDVEESFALGAQALNMAWKYQTPAIVLMDKILSEHSMTGKIDESTIKPEMGKIFDKTDGKGYMRYEYTEDGVSPMAFPGMPNAAIKITSYEHDAEGITTEEIDEVKKMLEKRFVKAESIKKEMENSESIKIYGDKDSKDVVVFFGSTKCALLEASKYIEKPVKIVQIVWLEPFDTKKLEHELGKAKNIINVEANHDGQLAALIRQKTGITMTDSILKYDSVPFDPIELAKEINHILKK